MRAVLRRRDALVVPPTGAGKSAIYQIPAVLLPGPTVVSPLPALRQDQIAALNERNDPALRAVRVSSAGTPHQQRAATQEISRGRAEFLFITKTSRCRSSSSTRCWSRCLPAAENPQKNPVVKKK